MKKGVGRTVVAAVIAALIVAVGVWSLSRPGTTHVAIHRAKTPPATKTRTKVGSGTTLPTNPTGPPSGNGSTTVGPVVEEGGLEGPITTFFAALKAGDDQEAYLQMTPTWRQAHSLSAFQSMIPSVIPTLDDVAVMSAGNFTAQANVTTTQGGSESTVSVELDQTSSPTASTQVWRMGSWPLPQ